MLFCNTGVPQNFRFTPPATACSRLSATLAFGLMDPVADPAIVGIGVRFSIGAVAIVILAVVVVGSIGNDGLARCEEGGIIVKRLLDRLGRVIFVAVEGSDEFLTKG